MWLYSHPERLYIRNKQHEHEEMKCHKCEHKMVAKKILVRHTLYDHEGIKDRPGKFVCNQCSTPFASWSGLRLHQRSEHEAGPMTVINVTSRQLSRFIWFNTSSVNMKESNIIGTSKTRKSLPSLILEDTKRNSMRVFYPSVQSVQCVQFEQCVHLVQ